MNQTSRGENGWENRFVCCEHDLSMGDGKLKRDGITVSFDEYSTSTCEAVRWGGLLEALFCVNTA